MREAVALGDQVMAIGADYGRVTLLRRASRLAPTMRRLRRLGRANTGLPTLAVACGDRAGPS